MADQGEEWMDKAQKKLKSFALFDKTTKYEEASEMFQKAANSFKMQKKWSQAAGAFIKAAECNVQLQSRHEAATNYINAANCWRKENTQEAVNCFKIAIDMLTAEGRFSIAAKHQKEVGELYEQEMDFPQAIENFTTAAEYFEGENAQSAANQCWLKVAQYSAQLEKYDKAIEIYENVSKASLDNNLLKWSVKEYFLKAALCHLCTGDMVSTKRALEKYRDMDPTFSSQRESKFLDEIVAACESFDTEAFTSAIVEYDSISKLDAWKTSILLKIKNSIKSEESLA